MAHQSEGAKRLSWRIFSPSSSPELLKKARGLNEVVLIQLGKPSVEGLEGILSDLALTLGEQATLIIIGDVRDLVRAQTAITPATLYQLWIAIRSSSHRHPTESCYLPNEHFGALVQTRYRTSLRHTKTRIAYSYCPLCRRTTKDYGGKKHTYHEYGTLLSDVWTDICVDLDGDWSAILERFADLFGLPEYSRMIVFDLRKLPRGQIERELSERRQAGSLDDHRIPSILLNGDCIEQLRTIPDDSVDFAFADPPYNLRKKYLGYSDDLAISKYFDWCDLWLTELARVLKKGRTCAVLNLPLWSVRHFRHLQKVMTFQNWIVWDALSFPVRMIMPAHYAILCFSKGSPRRLPALSLTSASYVTQLSSGFCLRAVCVEQRRKLRIPDSEPLSDLWADIHRLKHNSNRVDHPCQLPPHLMYRLVSIFTNPGEMVLDCFNGAGTTTLAAHQLERNYIGIELSEKYHHLAEQRHAEIEVGLDPFRKAARNLSAKNSPVPRLPKQKYAVPKKQLQLEIRRIARELGRIPTKEEAARYSKFPMDYYEKYFMSWGEACAAARTTGMSEYPKDSVNREEAGTHNFPIQPRLFNSD